MGFHIQKDTKNQILMSKDKHLKINYGFFLKQIFSNYDIHIFVKNYVTPWSCMNDHRK